MASIHLAAPPPFLAIPGEPSISWERWFSSFQTYLIASGLDGTSVSDERRRAILVHSLGTEGQQIFAQFPADERTRTLSKLFKSILGPGKTY